MVHGTNAGAGALLFAGVSVMLVATACGALAVALVAPAARTLAPPPAQARYADYLPFQEVDGDGAGLRCRNGVLVRTWRLSGLDHGSLASSERDRLYRARCACLDALAANAGKVEARMFTVRALARDQGGERQGRRGRLSPALEEVVERWAGAVEQEIYVNRHYLSVYVQDGEKGRQVLDHAGTVIESTLKDYGARLLVAEGDGEHPATVFSEYCSPASRPAGRVRAGGRWPTWCRATTWPPTAGGSSASGAGTRPGGAR